MRKITRSIGAGAESCTKVRAQNANGRVKSAKSVIYIIAEAFMCPPKIFRPLKWYPDRNFFGDGGGGGGGGEGGRPKKFF